MKAEIKISVKDEYKKMLENNELIYNLEEDIAPEVIFYKIKKEAMDIFFDFEIKLK